MSVYYRLVFYNDHKFPKPYQALNIPTTQTLFINSRTHCRQWRPKYSSIGRQCFLHKSTLSTNCQLFEDHPATLKCNQDSLKLKNSFLALSIFYQTAILFNQNVKTKRLTDNRPNVSMTSDWCNYSLFVSSSLSLSRQSYELWQFEDKKAIFATKFEIRVCKLVYWVEDLNVVRSWQQLWIY